MIAGNGSAKERKRVAKLYQAGPGPVWGAQSLAQGPKRLKAQDQSCL